VDGKTDRQTDRQTAANETQEPPSVTEILIKPQHSENMNAEEILKYHRKRYDVMRRREGGKWNQLLQ
jgi:hypothetical protein